MIYISVIFLLTLFFYIFFIFGSFLNNKLNVINRYNFSDCIIFGYAVFTVITFHTFFIFGVSNIYLLFFLIIFIIYFHFKNSDLLINKSKNIYIYLILFITLSLFFLYPVIVSGEQFYVFRGNYWDSFNYLSSALLFHKHSYQSLLDSNIINNYLEFQSIKDIINYRPYITYILSFYLNIKFLDLFLLNYTFKILLSLLNVFAFFSFLDIFKNISSAKKIILSIIFSFSFFSIYIFEIDALSHLGSISLLILSLKYIYLLFENNKNSTKNVIFLSVINSALFIIYPEIFVFFFIIFSCYCFDQIILKKKKNYFKTLVIYLFKFFIFTIGSYNTNYLFY